MCCVDKDAGKIERLKRGEIPIHGPGLDDLVTRNVVAGRLSFTLDLTRVKGLLKRPVMIDLRNIHNPADMARAGFAYHSIGRPAQPGSQP